MSILKHPLLLALAKLVEQERTAFKWIDLYTAQFVADSFCQNIQENVALATMGMADLFDEMPECQSKLNEADILVLTLICSQLVSQGQTHLKLSNLPQELMTSVKACAYRPSFTNSLEWLDGLKTLAQPKLLRVLNVDQCMDDVIPLDIDFATNKAPLVLCGDKLYLAKYWMLHQRFEHWLVSRVAYVEQLAGALLDDLSQELQRVFALEKTSVNEDVNWQAVSAAHTLVKPFSLITGGPGTGKTTTAASLLYMLMYKRQRQAALHQPLQMNNTLPNEKLHVRLLAPTGKAAVKLADSIRRQLKQIEARILGNDLTCLRMSDCLPETGETVHRFLYELGGLRDSFQRPKRFKGDEVLLKRSEHTEFAPRSKAALDVVIVDESSMMDLALMVELVTLIPPTTQLILLGDHDQLPAVDPGQVFTECVQYFSKRKQNSTELACLATLTGYKKNQLTAFEGADFLDTGLGFQPLCSLRKTYRFDGELKIAADQIKNGELHKFKKQFWPQSDGFKLDSAVRWYDLSMAETIDYQTMVNGYVDYFKLLAEGASLAALSEQFERYQLLCSTLEGPLGVHFLNTYIEQRFHSICFPNGQVTGELYHGKAILVTRNHPHLGIYNGDIGFVISDVKTSNLTVHFPVANHETIIVPPARIKEWQTAYAMTVHKSQGSEYQNVGVVLAEYAKELLSRALLYTALTRSKEKCDIWASTDSLERAFEN